ncbi:branched-chain amino acid ABC transporter permease [Bordetella pertussis]|nr:branched-chain amino acid ABC transporter permease [Bordetella pertussis]CPM15064.1 branched-chain amino acid ABC transporter permease [Bordetella pertussis]CPO10030.1 branched-chain amino acid ABC transporter permease [Bordetella pertussis]CPO91145.1 branched-chain amino acid ABC transporter permease [Bordetella pertussis]
MLGGLLLGVLEGLAGAYVSSAMKDVISYAVLILVMLLMPHGLFGKLIVKKV